MLQIARKVRYLLDRRGLRVAMTRTGAEFTYGAGGNVDRARFCNRRNAALMLRIHADGSVNRSSHGVSTLYPAWHLGWTDDIYAPASGLPASSSAQSCARRERRTWGSRGARTSPASTGRTSPWCSRRRGFSRTRPSGRGSRPRATSGRWQAPSRARRPVSSRLVRPALRIAAHLLGRRPALLVHPPAHRLEFVRRAPGPWAFRLARLRGGAGGAGGDAAGSSTAVSAAMPAAAKSSSSARALRASASFSRSSWARGSTLSGATAGLRRRRRTVAAKAPAAAPARRV